MPQRLLRAARLLLSYNVGTYRLLQSTYPNIPAYVLKDFLSMNKKDVESHEGVEGFLSSDYLDDLNGLRWSRKVITMAFHDLDSWTRQRIVDRGFGTKNPYDVPNDEERMQTQKGLVQGDGKNEPVVLWSRPDGYELLEGWHRTMNLLLLGKNGNDPTKWAPVKINAWIGR